MILLGAFVPLATVPMTMVLLVAIFTVHLPNGFSSIKLLSYDAMGAHFGQPGYETDLLYIAALLALCVGGAGPLSLDGYLTARKIASHTRGRASAEDRGSVGKGALRRPSSHGALSLSRPSPGDRLWPTAAFRRMGRFDLPETLRSLQSRH